MTEAALSGIGELIVKKNQYLTRPFNYGNPKEIKIPPADSLPNDGITENEAIILGSWWTGTIQIGYAWQSPNDWRQFRMTKWKISDNHPRYDCNFEIARHPFEFGVSIAPFSATNGHLDVKSAPPMPFLK